MPGKRVTTWLGRMVGVTAVLGLGMPAWAQAAGDGSTGAPGQGNDAGIVQPPDSEQPGGSAQPGVSAQPDLDRLRDPAGSSDDLNRARSNQSGALDRAQRDSSGQLNPEDRVQRDQIRQPAGGDRSIDDRQRSGAMSDQARPGQDWVRVGYDFDDDGQFDSFDYIPARELDRIRSASADQPGRLRGAPAGRDMNMDQRDRQREPDFDRRQAGAGQRFAQRDQNQSDANMRSLSGEIISMRLARYAGFDHDNVLACIQTDEGFVELVDLGPADNLQQFELALGEHVLLNTRQGIINNQLALIAEEVEISGGQFAQLENFGIEDSFQLRGTPVGPVDEFQERNSSRIYEQDQYRQEDRMRQDRQQQYERGLDRQQDRMMDRDRNRVWQRDQDRDLQRDQSLEQDRIRDRALERSNQDLEQDRLAPGEIESEMRRGSVETEIETDRRSGEFEMESESPRGEIEIESNR